MGNPWRGEVALILNGEAHECRLTLGALAELEDSLKAGSLIDLITRFENQDFSARDVLAVLVAGLRGGGWDCRTADLANAEIHGGPVEAARVAAQLLVRAFALPEHDAV